MKAMRVSWNQQWYKLNPEKGLDISIGVNFTNSVQAFGVGLPTRTPLRVGSFVGSVALGGSCNCDEVTFVPHCHATHTETVAHILKEINVDTQPMFSLIYLAQLITVDSQCGAVTVEMLKSAGIHAGLEALVIRTLPNKQTKKNRNYNDQASYMSSEAMSWLVDQGIKHLLIDTPSVDPINDGGALAAHRAFWHQEIKEKNGFLQNPKNLRTITELIFVSNEIEDDIYALQLNVANFALDAMPSRPMLFPIEPMKENQ